MNLRQHVFGVFFEQFVETVEKVNEFECLVVHPAVILAVSQNALQAVGRADFEIHQNRHGIVVGQHPHHFRFARFVQAAENLQRFVHKHAFAGARMTAD